MTETLAARMRRVRTEHSLSQVRLAELSGVARSTIRNVEGCKYEHTRASERLLTEALDRIEHGRTEVVPPRQLLPLSLLYTALDGSHHLVDGDEWDPEVLSPRERAVCRALLTFVLTRLDEADDCPQGEKQ